MSLIRRAAWLSVGVAAGVTSAPYLSSSTADPRNTSSCLPHLWAVSNAPPRGPAPYVDTAAHDVEGAVELLLQAAVRGAVRVRSALLGDAHHVACAASTTSEAGAAPGSTLGVGAAEAAIDAAVFRAVPHKLKDRFLHYAQRESESGEYVLTLDGFVRCMLLLPDTEAVETAIEGLYDDATSTTPPSPPPYPSSAPPQRLASPASWLQRLSPAVRRRFIHFFHCVDIDGTNSIGYAEFVVLFTFLSTRRQTLQRAFHVFDLDDNGRLSEREFCRLLNTIMVDPAVQVTYSASGKEGGGNGAGVRGAALSATSTTSRAGESRSSARQRQKHRHELNFDIESELLRPLLFGPLPQHIGAPPGSTHYKEVAVAASRGVVPWKRKENSEKATGNSSSSSSSGDDRVVSALWWSRVSTSVQQLWLQLSARGGGGGASSLLPPPSRMAALERMAAEDALLETVSLPTFLYRLDYLRWELRAIEFGLCDPANTGAISVEDCRRLLRHDRRVIGQVATTAPADAARSTTTTATAAEVTAPSSSSLAGDSPLLPPTAPVTWQSYQKLFDVIQESTTILPALQLMLDALPPVPADVLRGGAIPDAALRPATLAVEAVVKQTAQRYSSSSEGGGGAAVVNSSSDAAKGTAKEEKEGEEAAQDRFNKDTFGLKSNAAQPPEEARKQARRVQATLVRPTALTWNQFSQALAAVGTVPRLSPKEETLFRALLDDDASDSLSPTEFAHLCAMKDSFFAEYLPRFDEPKRNAVQQFFFCMQQLE